MTNVLDKAMERLGNVNVFSDQTKLVNAILGEKDTQTVISESDIFNQDKHEDDVLQWVNVTRVFAELLRDQDEVVLMSDYGNWWGRSSWRQNPKEDRIIEVIARSLLP